MHIQIAYMIGHQSWMLGTLLTIQTTIYYVDLNVPTFIYNMVRRM